MHMAASLSLSLACILRTSTYTFSSRASILTHGFTTTSKSKPSLQSIIPIDHLAAQNLGLGAVVVPNLQDRWCPFSCCHIHTTSSHIGLRLQTLGCNPVFTSWARRLRRNRLAVNDFFWIFWEDLGFLAYFCGGEGCFWCRKLCGFFNFVRCRGSLEVEEFFGEISSDFGLVGCEDGNLRRWYFCSVTLRFELHCYNGSLYFYFF